jgi:pyrroloquinoline quinone (PQQ) biosynthesis protein C
MEAGTTRTPCNSTRLSVLVEQDLEDYRREYSRLVNHWLVETGGFGAAYPAFLVETYHYVKHSCDLMRQAYQGIEPGRRALRGFIEQHIGEEAGHEVWLLDDLERLGFDRDEVVRSEPLSETVDMIGAQLYVMRFMRPAGLLGYVYLMESTPPNATFLRALADAYGLDPGAMTFLLRHGEADIVHREELSNVLDTLIEPGEETRAVRRSAVLGLAHVNQMIDRLRAGDFLESRPRLLRDIEAQQDDRPAYSVLAAATPQLA